MENKKKKNKILLQIVSLLIAVILWIIVGYTDNPSIDVNIKNVKVEYRGLTELKNRGFTITDAEKLPQISVGLRGKRSDLIKVLGTVAASVDVSGIMSAGTYELDITVDVPISSVQIIRQKSVQEVVIEPYVAREIPVIVKQTNTDKNKDILIRSKPVNDVMEITGAQSLIEQIDHAEILADVGDIYADSTQKYAYRLMSKANNEIDCKQRLQTAEPDLLVTHTVYTPVTVPVQTGLSDELRRKYAVNVKSISEPSVTVGVRDGVSIDAVTAMFPDDIYQSGSKEYTLTLTEPENVYIPDQEKTITVKAEFSARTESTVTLPVRLLNAPGGIAVSPIDVRIAVVNDTIIPDNITASVDLNGLSAGTHEVPVSFWTTDRVVVLGAYTVKVTI